MRSYLDLRNLATYLVLLVMFSMCADGSSDDKDAPALKPPSKKAGKTVKGGEFKARLHISDHVLSANEVHLEVQVSPNPLSFPGISINLDAGYSHRAEGWYDIVIRDISVPVKVPSPENSLEEIEREIDRFDASITYLRQILLSSPYVIVANPRMGFYNKIVADIYIVTGGQRQNVADMLLHDGHALPNTRHWQWGWRIPQVR